MEVRLQNKRKFSKFLKNYLHFCIAVEYSCLGDWFIGKNHFFAVVNTKESRKDEKYRCFLRNRDDDLFLAASITAGMLYSFFFQQNEQ